MAASKFVPGAALVNEMRRRATIENANLLMLVMEVLEAMFLNGWIEGLPEQVLGHGMTVIVDDERAFLVRRVGRVQYATHELL